MADQEFLASFAVDIDENGVNRLQTILSQNEAMAASLSASFDTAAASVRAFVQEISHDLPAALSLGNLPGGKALALSDIHLSLDTSLAEASADAFLAEASAPIPLSADVTAFLMQGEEALSTIRDQAENPLHLSVNTSGVISAARTAMETVRAIFSTPILLSVRAAVSSFIRLAGQSNGNAFTGLAAFGPDAEPVGRYGTGPCLGGGNGECCCGNRTFQCDSGCRDTLSQSHLALNYRSFGLTTECKDQKA